MSCISRKYIISQNQIFISGHASKKNEKLLYEGIVGETVTVEHAKESMICALYNCLAVIREAKQLENVDCFLNIRCYVAIVPALYKEISEISDVLTKKIYEIFGEQGEHARTTVGVSVLPGNTPVEVEMTVKLKEAV